MSGHSKWAQIKRQKAATDARRGQVFTKLVREITIAARQGVPDPEANFRLRLAVQKAREANMPLESIERAIKRTSGEGEAAALEEMVYEGYGPGGAAIMVAVTTDNRNRAVADIRNAFSRAGGSLGESGSVAWLFQPKGVIVLNAEEQNPEEIALEAIDAGADDVKTDGSTVEVHTQPGDLEIMREALEKRRLNVVSAENSMVPKSTIQLDRSLSLQVLRLMDRLEELDDVQKVYCNMDFPDDLLESYASQ